MSIVSLANEQSAWRGYEYWQDKKVVCFTKNSDESYSGVVSGTNGERYQVIIDLAHPRKSSCTCPYAAGRQIICKHKVALYFSAFPNEGKAYEMRVRSMKQNTKPCKMQRSGSKKNRRNWTNRSYKK